jgi:wyosine [tRNA(Phe)-imidazoG37] synthetase (radical SAM superfamily)
MSQVYGPVPSRRLGFSLGVDLVPLKTCTLDCIYCQLGRTTRKTVLRRPYIETRWVLSDLNEALAHGQEIDYITLSGSGEPTLNSEIGWIIEEIKAVSQTPVAVVTNGTLLSIKSVRRELSRADLVLPSLDAARQDVFESINRPYLNLRIERVIEGLKTFRDQFKGQIWLEVMLVRGINNGPDRIEPLGELIPELGCDRVQLNTVIRPPSEKYTRPLDYEEMARIRRDLGDECEIIPRFIPRDQRPYRKDVKQTIFDLLGRRPVTVREISEALGLHESEVIKYLESLSESGLIKAEEFQGSTYHRR